MQLHALVAWQAEDDRDMRCKGLQLLTKASDGLRDESADDTAFDYTCCAFLAGVCMGLG
jgi:hypothetical protein